jgi:hypothetical protein
MGTSNQTKLIQLVAGSLLGLLSYAIWRPYGGILTCIVFGIAVAFISAVPKDTRSSILLCLATGAIAGVIMMTLGVIGFLPRRIDLSLLISGGLLWAVTGGTFACIIGLITRQIATTISAIQVKKESG